MPNKEKLFVYFKDPECRVPLNTIEFAEPVVAGQKSEKTVYAKNVSPAELYDVEFHPEDEDVKVEKSSDKCSPQETIMLKFIFSPSEDRQEGLDSKFTITAKGIIRAKK